MNKENISSHSETWALLPILFAQKREGSLTEYSHTKSFMAFEDFVDSFPNKKKDYNKLVKQYFDSIISLLSQPNAQYFVEKTPRNYLIIDEIAEIFPDAKFIFLFRNPLGIVSSLLKTKRNNRFRTFYNAKADLFDAPGMLSRGYTKYENKSLKLVYDELVNNPDRVYKQISDYLNLKENLKTIQDIELGSLEGRLGDPNIKARKRIDNKSTDLWKMILNNRARRIIVKKYLKNLDEHYLKFSGFSKDSLIKDLRHSKKNLSYCKRTRQSIQDVLDLIYAYIVFKLKLDIYFKKKNRWLRNSGIE